MKKIDKLFWAIIVLCILALASCQKEGPVIVNVKCECYDVLANEVDIYDRKQLNLEEEAEFYEWLKTIYLVPAKEYYRSMGETTPENIILCRRYFKNR